MPELNALPAISPEDVTDDDLVLIFDNSAPTDKSRKATRAQLLKDVAREDGNHNFGVSEIDDLTATAATIINLTVTTSLEFDAAATLQKMYSATVSVTLGAISSNGEETVTTTLAGLTVADYLFLSFSGELPSGLVAQAWISAADTISIRFDNVSAGSIAGASYTAKIVAMRFA